MLEDDEHVCGHPLSETTKQVTDEAWVVPAPVRCQACTAISRAQHHHQLSNRPEFPEALLWRAEPRT